ncbi:hypothetical protein EYF80_066132 [Liparis tanakae]|uniref:Uncharacterized protein n=1 Tax=Liparis tanakae TaxID=230148 RepID=A0A4Z2E496_9TELE|nr:hypothetical protein EYF80_066132 [Liparis tanakae]
MGGVIWRGILHPDVEGRVHPPSCHILLLSPNRNNEVTEVTEVTDTSLTSSVKRCNDGAISRQEVPEPSCIVG